MTAYWITGDTRDVTAAIPDGSVDLILTSPPFLALRSYLPADHPDKAREIGSESTPADFIDTLLALTAEWRRVLAPHGSFCVELGDTYSGSGGAGGDYADDGLRAGQSRFDGSASRAYGTAAARPARAGRDAWPLDKSLCLIPELYRIGLVYGLNPLTGGPSPAGRFRGRNVVRWVRPNPPVGALGDKFRPATSDLICACTAKDRWFDLDAVRTEFTGHDGPSPGRKYAEGPDPDVARRAGLARVNTHAGAPPLDWWQIIPAGFGGAHYAVFPAELCVKPIEAMCPRRVCRTCGTPSRRDTTPTDNYANLLGGRLGDDYIKYRNKTDTDRGIPSSMRSNGRGGVTATATTTGWSTCGCPGTDGVRLDGYHTGTGWRPGRVLDPFAGSGTVAAVASGRGRDSIGIDLDERNVDLARERVGMFLEELSGPALACLLTGTEIGEVA